MSDQSKNQSPRIRLLEAIQAGGEESFIRSKEVFEALQQRERELEEFRSMLTADNAEREKRLHKEIAEREAALKQREDSLRTMAKENETRAAVMEQDFLRQNRAMQREMQERSAEHKKAIDELERQREQFKIDFQKKIEAKSAEYVNEALTSLSSSEKTFHRMSVGWALFGLLALLAALVLGYLLATSATQAIVSNKDIGWLLVLFSAAKGIVLLGVAYAFVRFCGRFSRAYMHESLKSAERRHAINYGKFYLGVYGAGSDWDKLKEAFAQWNISGSSAFSESPSESAELPQKLLTELVEKFGEKFGAAVGQIGEKKA